MGKHGVAKVMDIIDYIRSGNFDKDNGYSNWIKNWQTLKKLQNTNGEGATYLDYFWEQTKEKFEYK